MPFELVESRPSFPRLEQDVQAWWKESGIGKKTLDSGDPTRPFVFFEGPPTANGSPGLHHLEARSIKDTILRYRRMRGQRILGARAGWDTHGLPVEIEVERELGLRGKADIERFGIAEFNRACRASVERYIQDWERLTARIAYWIDLEHPYITCSNIYIESLWWILKIFWIRDLLYRDYKTTMHCPRCETSLSEHEVALGFREEVEDPSIWVRFRHRPNDHPLDGQLEGASFLAWTTTPWTLPANSGLALNPEAEYVLVERETTSALERVVVARARLETVPGNASSRIVGSFRGSELEGLRYAPLFFQVPASESQNLGNAHRVVADAFVSLREGTGIVHVAPAYGDLDLGRRHDLPVLFSVDTTGHVVRQLDHFGFGGKFFKDADPIIIRYLEDSGSLFEARRIIHAYPFCWRCDTPLLHYTRQSWYLRTTARKDRLLANNESINWIPPQFKSGRFGGWLANNVDWALSRERYWGSPLPIWICDECDQTHVVGSIDELALLSKHDLTALDLHRPYVDEISWPCARCQTGTLRRVQDVADVWFDSGSMPVAQWHYPFENSQLFNNAPKADYISEAVDQTRGWFYALHAVSTLLSDRPAFANVISLGHILDARGEKMSKSRGNAVDPGILIELYGADALRWYMYSSAPPSNSRRFTPEQVSEGVRGLMLTIWNTYAFFVTYANADGWSPGRSSVAAPNPLDRWIMSELQTLVHETGSMLETFDTFGPTHSIQRFADELSNWYVRRCRRRLSRAGESDDKQAAYQTLYACLTTLTRVLAPFLPHLSEAMYRNLLSDQPGTAESVHLTSWPEYDRTTVDEQLQRKMRRVLEIARLGRAARRAAGIRVRQPLSELLVQQAAGADDLQAFGDDLREELNVQRIRFVSPDDSIQEVAAGQHVVLEVDGERLRVEPEELTVEPVLPESYVVSGDGGLLVALNTVISPALRQEGQARDLVRAIQDGRKRLNLKVVDHVQVLIAPSNELDVHSLLDEFGDYIARATLGDDIQVGETAASSLVVEARVDSRRLAVGLSKAPSVG